MDHFEHVSPHAPPPRRALLRGVVGLGFAAAQPLWAASAQDEQLLASADGLTEIVRATLGAGADLASTNRYGGTGLIPACHHGHQRIVQLLRATTKKQVQKVAQTLMV